MSAPADDPLHNSPGQAEADRMSEIARSPVWARMLQECRGHRGARRAYEDAIKRGLNEHHALSLALCKVHEVDPQGTALIDAACAEFGAVVIEFQPRYRDD